MFYLKFEIVLIKFLILLLWIVMQKISGQFLSLSLFIILLAFFVFLRSLSNLDADKVVAVKRSVEQAFSVSITSVGDGFSLPPYTDGENGSGDAPLPIDGVKALFKSNIAGVEIKSNHNGTQMKIRADAGNFEAALEGESKNKASSFRKMLVSLLQFEETSGLKWRMEIILNVGMPPADLANKDKKEANLAIRRVSQMTERLEALGMQERMLTAGIGDGKAGTLDIYIRQYSPFDVMKDGVK